MMHLKYYKFPILIHMGLNPLMVCGLIFVNPKPFSELQAGPSSPLCTWEASHYHQLKTHSSIAWILRTFWITDPQPQKGPVKSNFPQNYSFEPSTCNHGCNSGFQLHATIVVVIRTDHGWKLSTLVTIKSLGIHLFSSVAQSTHSKNFCANTCPSQFGAKMVYIDVFGGSPKLRSST